MSNSSFCMLYWGLSTFSDDKTAANLTLTDMIHGYSLMLKFQHIEPTPLLLHSIVVCNCCQRVDKMIMSDNQIVGVTAWVHIPD